MRWVDALRYDRGEESGPVAAALRPPLPDEAETAYLPAVSRVTALLPKRLRAEMATVLRDIDSVSWGMQCEAPSGRAGASVPLPDDGIVEDCDPVEGDFDRAPPARLSKGGGRGCCRPQSARMSSGAPPLGRVRPQSALVPDRPASPLSPPAPGRPASAHASLFAAAVAAAAATPALSIGPPTSSSSGGGRPASGRLCHGSTYAPMPKPSEFRPGRPDAPPAFASARPPNSAPARPASAYSAPLPPAPAPSVSLGLRPGSAPPRMHLAAEDENVSLAPPRGLRVRNKESWYLRPFVCPAPEGGGPRIRPPSATRTTAGGGFCPRPVVGASSEIVEAWSRLPQYIKLATRAVFASELARAKAGGGRRPLTWTVLPPTASRGGHAMT